MASAHQQRLRQRPDQTDTLCGRNEIGRRDHAEPSAVPAREDLEPGGVLAHGVDDRLEHQIHLGAEIGRAQQVLDDSATADLGLELAREDHGAAAQIALGVIERVVAALV